MSEVTTLPRSRPPVISQPIACRLRLKEAMGRQGPIANMGEIELENLSSTPIEITYFMTVLQHLNLIVADFKGCVISQGHFGDRFAPTREEQTFRLQPREKFTAQVHLFATVPHTPPPGNYTIEAVYETNGLRAVSAPVSVTIAQPD